MVETKIYKGLDLLDKIFEFTAMSPDESHWNELYLKHNPPRQIRLRQIHSLAKAFLGQGTKQTFIEKAKSFISSPKPIAPITIKSILKGEFIKERAITDYDELISLIKGVVIGKGSEIRNEGEQHINQLVMPYQQLVKYKQQPRGLLTFNGGWLEASSIFARFSIYLTESITANLREKYTKLDTALELFINPQKLSFTEEELIARYNFPTEDLHGNGIYVKYQSW